MAESTTTSKAPATQPAASGPGLGDVVWVRTDLHHVAPAIVTDDFAGQNTSGVISVMVFLGHPYDANLTKHVPNCQPEMDDTPVNDIVSTYYGYWMPKGSGLRSRDLQAELDKQAEPKADADTTKSNT